MLTRLGGQYRRVLAWLRRPYARVEDEEEDWVVGYAHVRDLRWEDVREDWKPNDSELRDIYVFDTSIEDWQRLRDLVAGRWTYTTDTEDESPLPASMEEVFEGIMESCPRWFVQLREELWVTGHFFAREWIEFDVYPGHVVGQADLDVVCEFIRAVGATLQKSVYVCTEGSRNAGPAIDDHTIMRYEPDTDRIVRVLHPKWWYERRF